MSNIDGKVTMKRCLTLLESVFLIYGSVPQAIFPISTFSTLATITMSVWGLVTEKMAYVESIGKGVLRRVECMVLTSQ